MQKEIEIIQRHAKELKKLELKRSSCDLQVI